jgi:AraC family transcriptional regulator
VLDFINNRLDQDIKLAVLAALLKMSQFHFSHLLKPAIGSTPYQYLLQQRIERAKQLLKQSDRSWMLPSYVASIATAISASSFGN